MQIINNGCELNNNFSKQSNKNTLLINPPIYDSQYWAQWSQPYGLLRIATWLKNQGCSRIELFDFMQADAKDKVHQHRINPNESFAQKTKPHSPVQPLVISKGNQKDQLHLFYHHFGKTWQQFDEWLDGKGFTPGQPPDQIWVSAVMTYWWESVRDLIARLRSRFGNKTTIILGGIYPTLCPEHAAQFCQPDVVVTGEIEGANDLWLDLSLYEKPPSYAVITPTRGCPYNCAYCAQKTINKGRKKVHCRQPDDIFNEMLYHWETYGIRDFAFYADFLLWGYQHNLIPLLKKIAEFKSDRFRIYMPEGLDVRYLSQSQELVDWLKAANLQKVYLPCENINDDYVRKLNRNHVQLEHFVKAVRNCEKAGFTLRHMDINAFVLYGLPGESIDQVVKTILFVSEMVGSIIPMLFTPVPTTKIYQEYLPFIQSKGWDKDLHMLNGKLFPFIELNEGSVSDYVNLQRLMFTLNTHYRSASFQIFGDSLVSASFRDNISNGFVKTISEYKNLFDKELIISNQEAR